MNSQRRFFGRNLTGDRIERRSTNSIVNQVRRSLSLRGIGVDGDFSESPDEAGSSLEAHRDKVAKRALSVTLLCNPKAQYSPCKDFLKILKVLGAEKTVEFREGDSLEDLIPEVKKVFPVLEHCQINFSVRSVAGGNSDHRSLRFLDGDISANSQVRHMVYITPTVNIQHGYQQYPWHILCMLCISGMFDITWKPVQPNVFMEVETITNDDTATSETFTELVLISDEIEFPQYCLFEYNRETLKEFIDLAPADPQEFVREVGDFLFTGPKIRKILSRTGSIAEFLDSISVEVAESNREKVQLKSNIDIDFENELIIRASTFSIAEGHNFVSMRLQSEILDSTGYTLLEGIMGHRRFKPVPLGKWVLFEKVVVTIIKCFYSGGDGFIGLHPAITDYCFGKEVRSPEDLQYMDACGDLQIIDLWKKSFTDALTLDQLTGTFGSIFKSSCSFDTLHALREAIIFEYYVNSSGPVVPYLKKLLADFGVIQTTNASGDAKLKLFPDGSIITGAMLRQTLTLASPTDDFAKALLRAILIAFQDPDLISKFYYFLTGSYTAGKVVELQVDRTHEKQGHMCAYMELCSGTLFINKDMEIRDIVQGLVLLATYGGNDERGVLNSGD